MSTATGSEEPRPWTAARFEVVLRDLLTAAGSDPASTATFAEAGYTSSRYGLRLALPAGAVVYLQIIAARPPDGRSDEQGPPPPQLRAAALPGRGRTAMTAVERYLISVLTARQDPYVRWVEPLSALGGSIPYGLRITFHSGAIVCCYVAHALPSASSGSVPGTRFPSIQHI
ncbi:hypothetical protein [Streptomyces sp. RKAG337]|uniref:hypothetical protein n=1 Tax=Streptomyces sp. RKAG337 TaxID=2893404 RepID=UPI002034A79E|nr:hypothetical protein [Streptomyces sp. RKAG337]MCM2430955.1 hypothetical protein [Streptomyces sp. RKAG337]